MQEASEELSGGWFDRLFTEGEGAEVAESVLLVFLIGAFAVLGKTVFLLISRIAEISYAESQGLMPR